MAGFEVGTDGPDRILVAIDGSDTSLRAAAYGVGLARRQGASVRVVYVSTLPASAAWVGADADTGQEVAAELGRLVTDGLARTGVPGSFVHRRGDPYTEIVRVADEMRAEAIVVGASTQASHRVVGSLAGRLVKHAKWPVVVVP
jgi:nucleotide-binding universal stress UspA family protein